MVIVGEAMPQPRGKPASRLSLDPDFCCVLGVSITTDSVSMALLDFTGEVLHQIAQPLPDPQPETLLAMVRGGQRQLLGQARLARAKLLGIGVGMTGAFIGEGSEMNPPDPLDALALMQVDRFLAKGLRLPVWIDNDGTMAAVGESLLGVGQRHESFAYLHFAHGFGGGLVMHGRSERGRHGNAGEFSHLLLGQNLKRPALEPLRLALVVDGLNLPDIHALVTRFDPAWPAVDAWIEEVLPSLTLVVSAICAVLDPPAIVFGGRIPPALARLLIDRMSLSIPTRRGHGRPLPELLLAEAPQDAIAIGAASQVLKSAFFDTNGRAALPGHH